MPGRELHETAATEAFEEAGVRGQIQPNALGSYLHMKSSLVAGVERSLVEVVMFALRVEELSLRWPEMEQRERRWCNRDQAAELVPAGQLRDFLATFMQSHFLETLGGGNSGTRHVARILPLRSSVKFAP